MPSNVKWPPDGRAYSIDVDDTAPTLDGTEQLFSVHPTEKGGLSTFDALLAGAFAAEVVEMDRVADVSARIITHTAATLTIVLATHEGKIIRLDRAGGIIITMPEAVGSGALYRFIVLTQFTSDTTIVVADTTDTALIGGAIIADSAGGVTSEMFTPGGTHDLTTLDGTNQGGGLGCTISYFDLDTDVWAVKIREYVGGTAPATPFSST